MQYVPKANQEIIDSLVDDRSNPGSLLHDEMGKKIAQSKKGTKYYPLSKSDD